MQGQENEKRDNGKQEMLPKFWRKIGWRHSRYLIGPHQHTLI